jgi:asparagine synthase (glutamine-hydrolysing)
MGLLGPKNQVLTSARRIFARITFKLDYFYNDGLPNSIARFDRVLRAVESAGGLLGLHKFLHYRSWFRRELANYIGERVEAAARHGSGLWNGPYLRRLINEHFNGQKNRTQEINVVLTLEAAERLLLDGEKDDVDLELPYTLQASR